MASSDAPLAIDRAGVDAPFSALDWRGSVLVDSTAELPIGWTDVREAVDEMSRELRAQLVKPLVGRPAGPAAGRPPSP